MTTAEIAAANNAAWCDAVCRSHGLTGVFRPTSWSCVGEVPPLYPNLITLWREKLPAQLDEIRKIREGKVRRLVKDYEGGR